MGWSSSLSADELRAINDKRQQESDAKQARIAAARQRLAAKIVMVVVDNVVSKIIRPGPVAEERECYDMAGELRDFAPELMEMVKSILDVNNGVE